MIIWRRGWNGLSYYVGIEKDKPVFGRHVEAVYIARKDVSKLLTFLENKVDDDLIGSMASAGAVGRIKSPFKIRKQTSNQLPLRLRKNETR